jgi:hypothetical protein
VSDAYYDEFNRKRTLREKFRSLPFRYRIYFAVAMTIPVGAILFAVGSGVYALFWFNHREQATCTLTSFNGPHPSRNEYWNVATSCGEYVLNADSTEITFSNAQLLVETFQPGHVYRFTFAGWGPGREIIAATELKS